MVDREGRLERYLLVRDDRLARRCAAAAHLAALVAWEGLTDFYRDWARQGGMYTNAFTEFWWRMQIEVQRNTSDSVDWATELPRRELLDDWYRERSTDLSRVEVPLLSAGNWGAVHLHLRGNVEGFLGAASEHKWLVIHTGTHIDPYYTDWGKELQLRFLDRFLKGDDAAMDGVAPVRLAIRRGREVEWRDEQEWPLARHAVAGALPRRRSARLGAAAGGIGRVSGDLRADGGRGARADGAGGAAALGVGGAGGLRRLRSPGAIRRNRGAVEPIGPQGATTPVPSAIGWLRASHRKLDPTRTLPYRPFHPHDELQPLVPDEPTLLEVEIWPTSITLAPGETLRLELLVDDSDLQGPMAHTHSDDHRPARNVAVLVGGEHASNLLVPVIPQ